MQPASRPTATAQSSIAAAPTPSSDEHRSPQRLPVCGSSFWHLATASGSHTHTRWHISSMILIMSITRRHSAGCARSGAYVCRGSGAGNSRRLCFARGETRMHKIIHLYSFLASCYGESMYSSRSLLARTLPPAKRVGVVLGLGLLHRQGQLLGRK